MYLKMNETSHPLRTHCVPINRVMATRRRGYFRFNKTAVVLALTLFASNPIYAQTTGEDDEPKSTIQELSAWIKDLDSDDYSKRQLATLNLGKRKSASIPLVIDAVGDATGEKAERLLQFLSAIAVDPYSDSGKIAFDALNELAISRTTSKSLRAEKILQVIGAEQRDLTVNLLRVCRIPLRDRELQVMSSSPYILQPLVIDRQFFGNAEDLVCLKWLTNVQFARLEGPRINREVLQQVIRLPHLKKLQLVETELVAEDLALLRDAPDLDLLEIVYSPIGDEAVNTLLELPVWGNLYLFGTQLTQSGVQPLKSQLDGVDLFVSRGGFLGVKAFGNSTVIDGVVSGGAADRDGLRRGDKMLSVNGVPISFFEDLRKELAKFADGESVTIEVERRPMQDFQPRRFGGGGFGPGGFGPGGLPGNPGPGGIPRLKEDDQAELPKNEAFREKIQVTLGKRDSSRDR